MLKFSKKRKKNLKMDCASIQELAQRIPQYVIHFNDFNIIKTIGRGGFGEVYMAEHRGTGIVCALKKLTVSEQEFIETHQKYFIREVYILSKTQHPFLLQLLGFSADYPYCIATEFITNGSLYDALHHKKGSPTLNGTHLTIIGLVCSMALQSLHKKNIMHRDIKTLNVLLDEKCLPHICDFGISREDNQEDINETSLRTGDIGTPNWMAPELFGQTHYDNRIDIYAFGIMLWEMLTGEVPFAGKQPFVIMQLVSSGARPKIPPNTPPPLAQLISTCWRQDPNERVDFGKIARAFERHKVEYPGTDRAEVDKFIAAWKSGTYQNTQLLSAPQRPPGSSEVSQSPQAAPRPAVPAGLSQMLTNPADPNFEPAAIQAIQQANPATFVQLLQLLFIAFPQLQPEVTSRILKELAQLFMTNPKCAEIFIQSTAYINLEKLYATPNICPACNQCLEALFQNDYRMITRDLLYMSLRLCQTYPASSCACLANYVANVDAHFAEEVVGYMTFYVDYFKNAENADVYVDTLFFYASNFPTTQYIQKIVQAFIVVLTSGNEASIETAYRALTVLRVSGIIVPTEVMVSHLRFPGLVVSVLLYLSTLPDGLVISSQLISAIIEHVHEDKLAVYVLCLFAERDDTASVLIQNWEKWLSSPMIPVADSVRIFLACMCKPNCRPMLAQITKLSNFFKVMVESNDNELIENIYPVVKRLDLGTDFIAQCQAIGLLKILLQGYQNKSNELMLKSGLQMIEMLARKSYIPDYLEYLPYALFVIQAWDESWRRICVSLIFSVMNNPDSHNTLRALRLREYLSPNNLSPELMNYANYIFQTLGI